MKHMKNVLIVLSLVALGTIASVAAADSSDNDNTRSPYFLVNSEGAEVEQFPLLFTSADVNIAGVIADVKVTQIYKNEGKTPIEAIYVFPASTRAALYGMTMTLGERVIEAKVKERGKARKEYEQARQAGQTASLLEQQRPNVFQMNVTNILPGDTIKVELRYTELLVPTDGVYEFVYPTVVGPRYANQTAATAPEIDRWVANPYLPSESAQSRDGEAAPPYIFNVTTHISAGMPIQDVSCNSHRVDIDYQGQSTAIVTLDNTEFGGDRDYILKYRLAGGKIESGLLLYEGEDENFFLLLVQPPERVQLQDIPPREYIFIVDVSGSMNGFPLQTSKTLLRDLISNLRPTDTFNVVLFSAGSTVMSERSVPATQENLERAIKIIDNEHGAGGTELLPALRQALNLPKAEGVSRTMIIATDGFVNVETQTFELMRNNLNEANMFAFGIGSSVNRFLIEGMARVGLGEPFVVTGPNEAAATAEKFRQYVQSPVLTQIKADFGEFTVYDVEPVSTPDVLAERPVMLFGKWKGEPKGEITLSGFAGGERYTQTFHVSDVQPLEKNSALRYLWARKRIELLGDYNALQANDERVRQITSLGLTYNLLTAYTSFVAADQEVRRKDGEIKTVKQPLSLPQGVSDLAVEHGKPEFDIDVISPVIDVVGPVPEPATIIFLGLGLIGIIALSRKYKKR